MHESKALGLWTLIVIVVASMIGAGVFTTSGFALGDLGSPLRVLAAWLVGGLVAICGALSYGALARLIPDSAGEYLYLSRIVHPSIGFVAGWISLLAGFTAAIAYAALTFAAYAAPLADSTPLTLNVTATVAIGVAALLHALRVEQGAWVQNAAVAIKLALIFGFCGFAVLEPGIPSWAGLAELRAGSREIPAFSIAAFAQSLVWVSFSYSGFNAAVYIAGEAPSARENIPRALVLGTAVTTVVYLALNAVFVLVPTYDALAFREDVAVVAAQAIGGEMLGNAVRFLVALALLTSVSVMMMVGPRVYAKMADDGLFPPWLRFEGETPVVSIVIQGLLACVVVWMAQLRELLSYLGFTLSLSTACTAAALFVVVRRTSIRGRAVPGYPWAPAVFVTFTLFVAALAATVNPWEMLAAILTIGSGLLLYALARRRWAPAR